MHVARSMHQMQRLDKSLKAFCRPGNICISAESKMPESLFKQVFGRHMPNRNIVGANPGHSRMWRAIPQLHERNAQLQAGLRDGRRVYSTDDAVPSLLREPV